MESITNAREGNGAAPGKTAALYKCAYCGNNPVPHFINWYFESLNVLLTPIRQAVIKNPLSRAFKRLGNRLSMSWLLVRFFTFVRILSYQPDLNACKVKRAQVLWEEAEKRGIEMKELLLFGKPFDTYIAFKIQDLSSKTHDQRSTLHALRSKIVFSGLPRPFNDQPAVLDVMDDKAVLKKMLSKNGLPVPRGGSAATFREAKKLFRSIDRPAIVKPRVGSRGRHSTTFVYDEQDLEKAFRAAKQLCFWVMVEEQLSGPVFRATCINYGLCGVLRGDSPQVTGDGTKTVTELVAIKNAQRHPGVSDIVLDGRAELFLSRQRLAFDSVVEAGRTVFISEKIGVSYGGSSSEDFEICHPENKELFVKAAKALGDPIVGFDFIIQDITKPWTGQKCGFIEANSLPFINLHHDPLKGRPQNVATKVWDMVGM